MAEALDAAAQRWPGVGRARLLKLLVAEGYRAISASDVRMAKERLAAIERTAGAMSGVYPVGEITRLREDWPE